MAEVPEEGRNGATEMGVDDAGDFDFATEAGGGGEKVSRSGPVLLFDRYQIDPEKALVQLDSPSAQAYAASDRRDPGRELFALVCPPGLPPRDDIMVLLRGSNMRGVLPLVEWGRVYWPHVGQVCMAIIYERPLGGKVTDLNKDKGGGITEHDLPKRVIEPLIRTLQRLGGRHIAHRAIRPDNIYFLDAEKQDLVLGECASCPPGFDQPVVFETIECAMSSPGGRGIGHYSEDLYAFGVTLVLLLLGRNPVSGLSDEELITAKIESGTYATLCGNERIPVSLLEPLRGVLTDDPAERWGLDEMEKWLSGQRATPMQRKAAPKSEIPFSFGGKEHFTARTLGWAFSLDVSEAARVIRERQVEQWVRRGLKNAELADDLATALLTAKNHENNWRGSDDLLVTHVSIILDPDGPVRYKDFAFMPEGFGPAFAVEILRRGNVQIPAEVISREIPSLWFAAQGEEKTTRSALEKSFIELREYLLNNDVGYGIERCLYMLNPSLPCQSPLVIQDYVANVRDLLPALEDAAKRVDTKNQPMDRHIAAFIVTRFKHNVIPHLQALNDPDEENSVIGMLSLLAILQWRLESEPLYGLASWVGGLLGPGIKRYHSRTTRRELEKEIPRLVRLGSLPELFDLVDNMERRRADTEGYADAVARFTIAEHEAQQLESSDAERELSAVASGQQSAAMTSIVTTLIVACVIFLTHSW
jgi:hypothetical protein